MNNPDQENIDKLRQRIIELEARLVDLRARLPAHSLPPAIMAEMDELDELLAQAQEQLAALTLRN